MFRSLTPLVLILAPACGSPKLTEVETEVFAKSCVFSACHIGASPAGGLNLEAPTYAKLLVASKELPARQLVLPSKPDESFLVDKLLGRSLPAAPMGQTWTAMPPGGMIEQDRIDLVVQWIEAGANND